MRTLAIVSGFVLAWSVVAGADVEQTSSVLDGSGDRSGGGSIESISAAGQPGGISASSGSHLVNYAGFLGTFDLQPGLDTDADGLADEVDPDNDNDTLSDTAELNGSSFFPATPTEVNHPDTDADGVTDGDEARTGTNPQDDTMFLHITDLAVDDSSARITWLARGGRTYFVYRRETPGAGLPGPRVGGATALGGSGDWLVTSTNFVDDAFVPVDGPLFYHVGLAE